MLVGKKIFDLLTCFGTIWCMEQSETLHKFSSSCERAQNEQGGTS